MAETRVRPDPDPAAVLTRALLSAAGRLELRNRHLAEVIGTSEASISRLAVGRTIAPETKEGELGLLFLRLFRSLDALMGGDEAKSRAWLRAENTHIGGVPADVSFRGLSGAGLYQINVVVPPSLADGDREVVTTINGVQSPPGVFLAVGR